MHVWVLLVLVLLVLLVPSALAASSYVCGLTAPSLDGPPKIP